MMNIEDEVFKRAKVNQEKLLSYGFVKDDDKYKYSKKFMNTFRADITILKDEKVNGKIYDLSYDDEYTNFRIENEVGEFVNSVRENYKRILENILDNCFSKEYFITDQANRITNLIKEKYNNMPEFAWDKFPGYGIFRNPNNEKWYSLIMNINKNKLDEGDYEVEIINLKLNEKKINKLLTQKGFYKAYHMNKENWISIILDNTLNDDEIMSYIEESHKFTEKADEWIIPANPKYYDIINCFNDTNSIIWKQSNNIKIGDIVYLYVTEPYSAILYKCEVQEVNIPYEYSDKNVSMKKVMKIKLIEKYKENAITLKKLNEYGIKAIRGPRSIPEKLSKDILKYC